MNTVDAAALAKEVTPFLAPFLPYLLKAGEEAAKEAGRKFGADAWERAKTLWARLRPRVEASPAAKEAVLDAAATPDDADALAAFRHQLKKLLAEDEALAAEVARLWADVPPAVRQAVVAVGDRSVAIGGDAEGNIIVTGDNNVVG